MAATTIGVLGGLGGGALAALLFATGIVRRVEGLGQQAERLARGQPPLPARPAGDELGALERRLAAGGLLFEREAALRASEERLRAVITNLPIVLFVADREGVVILSEGKGLEALGRRPGEAVGRTIFELYRGEPQILDHARRALDGETITATVGIGALVHELWCAPLRDEGGAIDGIIGIIADITERARAEEQLRRTLEELEIQYANANRARGESRAVLDATSEGMALIAPDRRFLTINQRFTDLFSVAEDEVRGKRFEAFSDRVERVFAEPAEFAARIAGTAADPERRFTAVFAQRWPEERELELFSTPARMADGQHLGRLYVFRDVTREREIDRMKTEFVSLVSHELRTPLTSIKGFVDLLLDGDVGEVTGEQREFLEIVRNNADRLIALINELLDVSRIEAGKVELRRAPLDLAPLLRDVAESLRPQIEAKGQTLALDLPAALPAVSGDADRVTQIVTNLLSNAHKYTPAGGALRIGATIDGAMLRVAVRDSGIGLAPDEQSQLFTKFFRARNRTTQEVGGTSLGLAITRSLVEMHGGAIAVTSAPGAGSTFSFTLPLVREADTTDLAAPLGLVKPGGCILVVDDEPDIVNLIRRYLERAGYRVVVARDAATALEVARAERPDLITLDVMLPDSDGFAVLERLKSDAETAAIPVLILSIVDDGGRGKLLGAVDYLGKPVDERSLLQRVGAILANDPVRRVLLADDDPDVRALIAGLLRRAGYQVIEAAGGVEALAAARSAAPRLALLDIRMPDLDGMAVLRALRAEEGTRDLPVIMMTASPGALEANRSAIEALNNATLLAKPLSAEELAAVLARGW